MPVPFSVISSVVEFQAVFTPQAAASSRPSCDAFLLCYEVPADKVTAEALQAFRDAVDASAATHKTNIVLHMWDCTSDAFAAAKAQLGKAPGEPLLLVVYHGAIADTVRRTTLTRMAAEDVPRVCERLTAFQQSAKPAQVVPANASSSAANTNNNNSSHENRGERKAQGPALRVDVAKIMHLGQDLLAKGEPEYAEKAFVKALDALRVVEAEMRAGAAAAGTSLEDYEGSVAMTLAWAGLAQIVQGKALNDNTYLRQLTDSGGRFTHFCEEPLTDACRVVTTQQLMRAAPWTWTGATCSQKALGEALRADPMDHASRAMLTITLFLAGDLERALTEAIKLNTFKQGFGRVALKKIVAFLGPDHVLVKQLGPLTSA